MTHPHTHECGRSRRGKSRSRIIGRLSYRGNRKERAGLFDPPLDRRCDQMLNEEPAELPRANAQSFREPINIFVVQRPFANQSRERLLGNSQARLACQAKHRRQGRYPVRETFGQSPSEIRRSRFDNERGAREGGLVILLPYRPPFHWNALISFLQATAVPGVEKVEPNCYRRTIKTATGQGVINVSPDPNAARTSLQIDSGERRSNGPPRRLTE
jgi:hypothetical protein